MEQQQHMRMSILVLAVVCIKKLKVLVHSKGIPCEGSNPSKDSNLAFLLPSTIWATSSGAISTCTLHCSTQLALDFRDAHCICNVARVGNLLT